MCCNLPSNNLSVQGFSWISRQILENPRVSTACNVLRYAQNSTLGSITYIRQLTLILHDLCMEVLTLHIR